ncbi:hypothetical protein ACYJ1Y_18335 [Natrialbaceae archaeon A-gly3]
MSTVISAEIPDSLENRLVERQEPDESRSAAIRRTLRDGTTAPGLRRENRELHEKLENRENQIEELREELDEYRERDAQTIALPRRLTLVAVAWAGLIWVADGTGLVTAELQIGTTALGIMTLAILTAYATYTRYTEVSA